MTVRARGTSLAEAAKIDALCAQLVIEWHPTKNGDLTPESITAGSDKKVWWLGDCGHDWEANLGRRARRGSGCPVCSGQRVLVGYNDLVTTHPELAAQWHPAKNGDLTPERIAAGSNKKFWWLGDCGHDWETPPNNRSGKGGSGCPICSGNRVLVGYNDLVTTHPELAAQWHPTKNKNLTPKGIAAGSHKKVWWLGDCGHDWEATLAHRSRAGSGCPMCSGQRVLVGYNDLVTTHPELAAQWHPAKNGDLTPERIAAGSQKKVWWLGDCGHDWETTLNNRSRGGNGCPVCSGQRVLAGYNDLVTTHPELAAQWHPTKNKNLTPKGITAGSNKKFWWLGDCGHAWEATLNSRSRKGGNGCPKCCLRATSKVEKALRDALHQSNVLVVSSLDHTSRVPVQGLRSKTVQADIVGTLPCGKRVVIEYGGSYWHGSETSFERDLKTTKALLETKYLVVRVREVVRKSELGFLDMQHENLLQIRHIYSLTKDPKNVDDTVLLIEEWLRTHECTDCATL